MGIIQLYKFSHMCAVLRQHSGRHYAHKFFLTMYNDVTFVEGVVKIG